MPELVSFPFVQRAAVAVLLASVLLGGLSHLVVARRLAFFSAAIGQAVLTGVSLGVLLGEPLEAPWGSVLGFSLLVGVALVWVRRSSVLPTDTIVGVFLAFTLGLGVCLLVFVTKRFNVHQLEAVMFGSLLTVTRGDLLALFALSVVLFGVLGTFSNRLLLGALDVRLRAAAGPGDARDEYLFVVLLTAAIVVSVKVMGALMVEALLVVPAAAARNVSRSVRGVFLASIAIALTAGLGGLALSTQIDVPSGAAIVMALATAFLCTLAFRSTRRA
jgi:zinc transport system permease protein